MIAIPQRSTTQEVTLRKGERLVCMDCGQHVFNVEHHICVEALGWRMNALRILHDYSGRIKSQALMN